MTLPMIVRSASTPVSSWAPPRATRKPLITSSSTSSAPVASARSRSSSRKPSRGGTRPMLAGSGSARIAASSWRSVAAISASASFHGTTTVRRRRARRHAGAGRQRLRRQPRAGLRQQPVDVAVVGAGELQRSCSRPVAARARRTAVIAASVPGGGHAQHLHARHPRARPPPPARPRRRVGAPKLVPLRRRLGDRREHIAGGRGRGSAAPTSRRSR